MSCLTLRVTPTEQASLSVEATASARLSVLPADGASVAIVPGEQASLSVTPTEQASLSVTPTEQARLTIGEVCSISSGEIFVLASTPEGPLRTRDGGYILLSPNEKVEPYFTAVGGPSYSLAYVNKYGNTILVGNGDKSVAVWEQQTDQFKVPFNSQTAAINPSGCSSEDIGRDIGMSLCDGSMVFNAAPEGYEVSNEFSIGKVVACSASGAESDMLCEIIYNGSPVSGWVFVVPQSDLAVTATIRKV